LVSVEVAKAKDNVGQFPGGEAVNGGAAACVVSDDGESGFVTVCGFVLGAGGGRGQGSESEQKEKPKIHEHGFDLEKYLKRVVTWRTNFLYG
jgi:hypothetical protein